MTLACCRFPVELMPDILLKNCQESFERRADAPQ